MIANARMYGISPEVGLLWRNLFSSLFASAGLRIEVIEHAAPAALDELWGRSDMSAVFMCGLPFSRAEPRPLLVAAPVPAPDDFGNEARYWSEFVVRRDSHFGSVPDTFGRRIAFTVPDSQSGCLAALSYLMTFGAGGSGRTPLFAEIVAPAITPLGALEAVIGGGAEIAPIDSYALRLLRAYRADLTAHVRVVGRTVPTPIPPLVASPITIADGTLEALSSALLEAHRNVAQKALMDKLLLWRFVRPNPDSYDILRERFVAATRFWRSHPLAAVTHSAFGW